jgi:hypothetical protein
LNSLGETNSDRKSLLLAGRGRDWGQSRGGGTLSRGAIAVGDTATIDSALSPLHRSSPRREAGSTIVLPPLDPRDHALGTDPLVGYPSER